MSTIDKSGWFPIASSDDLPLRHVYHGELWGQELAVWRADDNFVNVWENRCLHRGVRLSIGTNLGGELRCQYHGWRYASRNAGCTYIPAHPADAPARTICNTTFASHEQYGLVWTNLDACSAMPDIEALDAGSPLPLRAIAVNASPSRVFAALRSYEFPELQGAPHEADELDQHALVIRTESGDKLVFFIQPVDSGRAVIRGVLAHAPSAAEQGRVLRAHDHQICRVRDLLESEPVPAPDSLRQDPRPAATAISLSAPRANRQAPLRVMVTDKTKVAQDVIRFRLEPVDSVLPAVQPGAHIDVHLPNGLIRQYSITNGPQTTDAYEIGVKREADSRGGSTCLHDTVAVGDLLALSEPLNNFPLRRDALKTILIAGGIGITPLLAMARTLHESSLPFELHHFARDAEHAAFADALNHLGESTYTHLGLNPADTGAKISDSLGPYADHRHVYICGPAPMIEAARESASALGWPEPAVHYEHFKNEQVIDSSTSFEIALSRSGLTLKVPAGKTIIEVLRENSIGAVTSCEQGACGTCKLTVIDGVPHHQDVYLTPSERASNQVIMACVSRAKSERLVLDI